MEKVKLRATFIALVLTDKTCIEESEGPWGQWEIFESISKYIMDKKVAGNSHHGIIKGKSCPVSKYDQAVTFCSMNSK